MDGKSMKRKADIERSTKETKIRVALDLDGEALIKVATGLPFMDHMLEAFARHGRFGLQITACGDLQVDAHHTMEDIGLVLGSALRQALGDKGGIVRFGSALVPMDEALAQVVVDLSGRPHLAWRAALPAAQVNQIPVSLFSEFFQALANTGGLTVHVSLQAGEEEHHCLEAIFKAFGRALRQAVDIDAAAPGKVPSTKGSLD